jgi:FtsH-binding integral membrane protein
MSMYPQSNVRRPMDLEYARDNRAVVNFFNTVYAWMAVGLALTAAVAWFASQSLTVLQALHGNRGIYLVFVLGTVGISWYAQAQAGRISANVATALFLIYAVCIGVMISWIFLVYSPKVLISAFLLTAGTFGGMSVYGFVTKRDLSRIGSILVMCTWGLLIASVVNLFIASGPFSWLITYATLAVFIGLTAYETQTLKELAHQYGDDPVMAPRFAIFGSLILYMSFIAIFMAILRILGRFSED